MEVENNFPLLQLLISKVERNFENSELYKKVHDQIKEAIVETENEIISFDLPLSALEIKEKERSLEVSINPKDPWYGVFYTILRRDKLQIRVDLMIKGDDIQGNTRDVGDSLMKAIFPPVFYYKQIPNFSSLAESNKIATKMHVYLPREKSRFFQSKASVELIPMDCEAKTPEDFRAAVYFG